MLRSAGKVIGGTAAGLAASSSSSHCRAQQPRITAYGSKDEHCNSSLQSSTLTERREEINGGWVVTDLKRQLDEDEIVFGSEEVDDTMRSVLSFVGISTQSESNTTPAKGGSLQMYDIQEPDSDNEEADSNALEYQMRAAEMQLAAVGIREDFSRMLNTMVHNEDVQRACIQALKNDPAFKEMLDAPQTTTEVSANHLLPAAAKACYALPLEDVHEKNPFEQLLQRLAENMIHFGEKVKLSALGTRDAIGRFFLNVGFALEDIWRQASGKERVAPPIATDGYQEKAEMMGNAVISVTCAILSLVLLKRIHYIRFV